MKKSILFLSFVVLGLLFAVQYSAAEPKAGCGQGCKGHKNQGQQQQVDPEAQKPAVNLLAIIKQLHEAGVKIRILTTPPALIEGVERWKQADALQNLASNNVEFRLCSHIHFNGVLIDDAGVWRGTAPLTEKGLSGLDDVAEYSTAQWLKAVYLDLFRDRWEQSDLTCSQCFEKTCLTKFKAEDPRRSYEDSPS